VHRWLRVVLVVSLVTASVIAGTPARADHRLRIVHRAQPAAAADRDLTLVVGVDTTCGLLCRGVVVRVAYLRPDGSQGLLIRRVQPVAGRTAAVALTIPAVDVRAPALAYSVSAAQVRCWPFAWVGPCDHAKARAPQRGSFEVSILEPPDELRIPAAGERFLASR
jgi:hypothetical protein